MGDRLQSTLERLGVQILETSTGDLEEEIIAIEERVNLNSGLSTVREGTLGTLASSAETTESTRVGSKILLVLPEEKLAYCDISDV